MADPRRPTRNSRNLDEWSERTLKPSLERHGERDVEFSTVSSMELERLSRQQDGFCL